MKVYRGQLQEFKTSTFFPMYTDGDVFYTDNSKSVRSYLQPALGTVVHTGNSFQDLEFGNGDILHDKYYYLDSVVDGWLQWVEIVGDETATAEQKAHARATICVYDIMEWQYNGKDMGERSVTATIKSPLPIDFRIGDYITVQMQTLRRGDSYAGAVDYERFYIYSEVTAEKNARADSAGDAFVQNVIFYPRQYELGTVLMRDFVQQSANVDKIIYTGFDKVSFYGGAYELLMRCMACLREAGYVDNDGNDEWTFDLADSVNEQKNSALERYAFAFDGEPIQNAILKLNSEEFVNTTWFINERKIYVGYKRPYLCAVNELGAIADNPLKLTYGKTSQEGIYIDHGGLFKIKKAVGKELPITKLFAYGADRNLNRYYDSDRIKSGRYVTNLMLPSFSDDGRTDYIINEDGVARFGMREGKKQFEEIYPSLRYMTYADIRGVKYCIKVKASGLSGDKFTDGVLTHDNTLSAYPIARIQCYKVTPCTGEDIGHNKLVECAPPEDLAIFIHATGKTVKCRLCGGENALQRQLERDGRVPTTDGASNYIPGACFAVHDNGWDDNDGTHHTDEERATWFNLEGAGEESVAHLHRIEYVDTFGATDLYVFTDYNQSAFRREGYSLWAWPRLNNYSGWDDSLPVNEVVAVEPVVIPDTSDNINRGRQQTFDIYLRDVGFDIDEQNDFGEMVFVFDNIKVSVIDGLFTGREFDIDGGSNLNGSTERCCCALTRDGKKDVDNPSGFFAPSGYTGSEVPYQAYQNGAIWRLRLVRSNVKELETIGIIVPNVDLQMPAGSHIVLLDIYMPDIYIRAAEQRLLTEATKYLLQAGKADINYSVEFDKVRIQQIPNYPLQMREGVNLRLVDDDLNIKSINNIRKLVDNIIGEQFSVSLYTADRDVNVGYVTNRYRYTIYRDSSQTRPIITPELNEWLDSISVNPRYITAKLPAIEDAFGAEKVTMKIQMSNQPSTRPDAAVGMVELAPNIRSSFKLDGYWYISLDMTETDFQNLNSRGSHIEFILNESIVSVEEHRYNNARLPVYAKCRKYINFSAGKYYEVIVDVDNELVAKDKWILFYLGDESVYAYRDTENDTQTYKAWKSGDSYYYTEADYAVGSKVYTRNESTYTECGEVGKIDNELFQLFGFISEEEGIDTFVPEYEVEELTGYIDIQERYKRLKFSFYLDSSFNDSHGYYPGVKYIADGEEEYAYIYLVSVIEKDMDAEGSIVNYVDMIADSVTIKVNDNTRGAETRVLGSYPEPIREVGAVLKEKTQASAWTKVISKVNETAIESEKTRVSFENLAIAARQYYRELLMLRDNIFDPDGTCDQTFLHIMMLQVGADSMNYQLDKTYYTIDRDEETERITEVMHNFTIVKENDVCHFKVFEDDTLRHFVYTAGAQGGTWIVKGGFDATLASTTDSEGTTVWPVYFVCIRCLKDAQNNENEVQWICSPKQYAVNDPENTNYWYFNWGILQPDGNGNYSLVETRGNAYMYGDNIVAGRIETLAGNSYFDLTHGNFVLTQGTESDAALSYINGVLTINGYKSDELIRGIMERLGLAYLISNENNIFNNDPELYWGIGGYNYMQTGYALVQNAKNGRYIIAYDSITALYRRDPNNPALDEYDYPLGNFVISIGYYDSTNNYVELISNAPYDGFRDIITLPIDTDIILHLSGEISSQYLGTATTPVVHSVFTNMIVQYYDYNSYFRHLTDALKGSTEISGGLVLTNLIMLKNEADNVIAGMSGLTDNSREQGAESEGVTLWSGGTYAEALAHAQAFAQQTMDQLGKILPVLITKTGIGSRIGCFEITSENSVSVRNGKDTIEISTESGIRLLQDGVPRIIIANEDVTKYLSAGSSTVTLTAQNITSGSFAGIIAVGTLSPSTSSTIIANMQGTKLNVSFRYTDIDLYAYWVHFYLKGKITFVDGSGKVIHSFTIKDDTPLKYDRIDPTTSSIGAATVYGTIDIDNMTQRIVAAGSCTVRCDLQLTVHWKNGWAIQKKEFIDRKIDSIESFVIGLAGTLPTISYAKPNEMVVMGNNGALIKTTDSNYVFVKTTYNPSLPCIDIRVAGLPSESNVGSLATNQLYLGNDNTIKKK